MKIMKKNTNWHGLDESNEISLMEYDFLIRWSPENSEYQVVYKFKDRFYNSWYNHESWLKDLRENIGNDTFPNVDRLAAFSGCDEESYLQSMKDTPQILLSDLFTYHGSESILGTQYYEGESEPEIRKRLNKILNN